ncbi:hypothetical protein KNSL1_013806, partial [Colletotrichum chrysophilum]
MDLSMAQKTNRWNNNSQKNGSWKKDKQCYNCNQKGHLAYECKEPKKQKWQPVHERTKQISMATKTPHASLSWTGCYNDNCPTHQSDKEASGYYPRNPDQGRSGYDDLIEQRNWREEIAGRPKTLAMAFRANSKMARETVEQLDEMLRIQQLGPASSSTALQSAHEQELDEQVEEESDEEPDHQHDPMEEQRLLNLTSNWTFGEGESSQYDSEEPRDVARQRAQAEIAYGFTPSVDDTSSEEESDDEEETRQLLRYQTIDMKHNEQQRYFYGTPAN